MCASATHMYVYEKEDKKCGTFHVGALYAIADTTRAGANATLCSSQTDPDQHMRKIVRK